MIRQERLLDTFLELVRIDSPSGEEAAISALLAERLRALEMEVCVDERNNVLGRWQGTGEPLLLSAHMDTVVPGKGVKPEVSDGVVRSDGTTILGADDKSGVAVILEVLTAMSEQGLKPAVEVAFSVSEESGLLGAKAMDAGWFQAKQALVLDGGGSINTLYNAAPVSDKLHAVIHGRAAHAGVRPEDGINAIVVASHALVRMRLGRIDHETTANIGRVRGGRAVNIVPDVVELWGEARSHDRLKLDTQISSMRKALEEAVAEQPGASLEVDIQRSYEAYHLPPTSPIIQRVAAALKAMGEDPPDLQASGGGSDANILNQRGIAAVPISTGMQAVHTTAELVAVADMGRCAELVWHTIQATTHS